MFVCRSLTTSRQLLGGLPLTLIIRAYYTTKKISGGSIFLWNAREGLKSLADNLPNLANSFYMPLLCKYILET